MRGDTRDSSHERPPPREREGSSFPCRTIPTGPQAKPVSLGSIKSTGGVEAASASTIQTFKLKTRRIRRIEPRKKEPVEPEPPPLLDDNSDDLEGKDSSDVKVTSEVKVMDEAKVTRRKRCSSSVSHGEELEAEVRVNGQDLDSTCSDEDKEMLAIKHGPRDLSPNGPQSLSQELSPMSLDPASLSPDLPRSCDPSPSLSHDLSTSSSHDWDDLVSQESWEHSDTSGDVNHNKENVEDNTKKMTASPKATTSYDWFDECEREEQEQEVKKQEVKKQEVAKQDVKENGILGEAEDWSEENDEELEGGAKFMSSIRKCARRCKEEVVSFKRIPSREDVRLSRDSGSYSVRYSKGAISRGRDYELSSQKSNYSSRAEKCQGYRSELGTSRSEKYHGYGYKREQLTSCGTTAAKYAKLEYDGVTTSVLHHPSRRRYDSSGDDSATLHHPSRRRYDSAGDESSDGRIRSHHVAPRGPRTFSASEQYRISPGTTRSMPARRSETSRPMSDRPRTVLSRPRHRSDQTVDYPHASASSSEFSHREDREHHCDARILDVESARLRENTNDSAAHSKEGERRGLSHRNDSQCVIRERTADVDSDCDVSLATESDLSAQCSSSDKHRSVDRRCNIVTGRSRTDQVLSARDHDIIDKTCVDTEPICAKTQCQEGDRDHEPRDQEGRDSPQNLQGLERDSETSEPGDSESDLDAVDCDLVAADDTTRAEASIVSTEDEDEEEDTCLEDTDAAAAGGSTERILVKRVTASCSVGDLDSSPEQEPEEEQGILCTRAPSSGRGTLSTRHSPPHGGATNVPSLPKTVTFAKNVKPADSDDDDDHVTYRQPIRSGLGYRGPIRSKRSGSVRFEASGGGVSCVDGGGYHCNQDYPGGLATVHHLHHLPVHPHHIQGGIATAVVLPVGGGHPQVSPPLRNIPSHHTHPQVSPPLRNIPSSHAPGTTTVIPVRAANIPSPPIGAGSFNPSHPGGVGSAIPKRSYLSLPLELDSSEVDSTTSSTDLSPGGPPSDTPSPSTTYCTAGTRTLQPGEVYYFSSNSSVMCVQRGKLRPPTPPMRLQRPSTPPSTRIQVGYLQYTSLFVCHLFS